MDKTYTYACADAYTRLQKLCYVDTPFQILYYGIRTALLHIIQYGSFYLICVTCWFSVIRLDVRELFSSHAVSKRSDLQLCVH